MTFKERCIELGISPSYTRMKIYDYLHDNKVHPTVDEIYKELKNDLPTLSKTTVYNVLDLFINKGIAMVVNVDQKQSRYELNEEEHSHFQCMQCNQLFDIPRVSINLDRGISDLYNVMSQEVVLKGICNSCKQKDIN